MIKRVLKSKLVSLGYGAGFVEGKMKEFAISLDASKYTEGELQQRVNVIFCEKPNATIPRFYLNIEKTYIDKFIFDGKLDSFAKFSMVGSQIMTCDYTLSEKLCIIGITEDLQIDILMYNPSDDIKTRYSGKTYEEIYGEERETEAGEYLQALTAGGRVPSLKAKDILYVLMSEYVIDLIMIENLSPRIRLYDNAAKFAEVITNYEYKYINRRINRIEFVEKTIEIRNKGAKVEIGNISNDPYLLLSEVNHIPDFSLNTPTYVWLVDETKQDILAIFSASERYNKSTYRELYEYKDDPELRTEVDKITMRFSNEVGYAISRQYINSVFKKLNRELIVLPVDIIRKYTQENYDYIEPLRYKFTVIKNRRDFESVLYNSIENNLNGRYKYRFVEKLSGIYLTIGNKLNYTDLTGNLIRKQSIADFNINYNAAVIKRETIIDSRSIPQLMGYIYKDVDNIGTDMLPVPSIEVVFYFPDISSIGRDVEMYNGTAVEVARGDGISAFSEIGLGAGAVGTVAKPRDPNEKFITVKYINSDGEILKENIIRDVMIGSIYTPEIIPVINDKEGKEWIISGNQIPNVKVTDDNTRNIVEVRYVKKISKIRINYINKQGGELAPPVIKNIQVGESFNMENVKKFIDKSGTEWNLYQCNPTRLTISENESANVLTLVYDVIKADVFISYKNRQGIDIKPQDKISAVANKEFKASPPLEIVDGNGLLWEFGTDSRSVISVSETDLNIIELYYDEKKVKVITSFIDTSGVKIKDDVVDFVQAGRKFIPKFEAEYVDIYGKWWKLLGVDKQQFIVSKNELENICIVSYDKICSTIMVSMLNEQGGRIRDDIVEQAQIGTTYTPNAIKEIEDINGLIWECVEGNKSLTVSQSEVQNRITYKYVPMIVDVCFQYVDDEGNELIPQRVGKAQAGNVVTPELIGRLTSQDQRGWVLSTNNQKSFKVKRHKEENIFKINYDKSLVNVFLSFKNVKGDTLKADISVEAQIGSEYNASLYNKITADNGERWMIAKTEPQVMFVRENAKFTLIYDEIKARVVVKCVNISDNVSIVDDAIIVTKLGGVFVPNIMQRIFDKNKRRWKYVGEPAMSIIAKENEQENIITLKYEPDVCNVILRYVNSFSQHVHKDVIKSEQIGSTIAIKEYDKIIEENGMGWKLSKISRNSIVVDEKEDNNIVISTYIPLIVDVTTRYIDNDGKELVQAKTNQMQVGQTFEAEIIPKVTDVSGKVWKYSDIKVEPHKVVEEANKVNIKYVPLIGKVCHTFINTEQVKVQEDKFEEIQVGSIFPAKPEQRVIDKEGKNWILKKTVKDNTKITEDEKANVLTYIYDKEMIDVTVKFSTDEGVPLLADKVTKVQIGSKFHIESEKTLQDSRKLWWIQAKDNVYDVVASPNLEENVHQIKYEKYMVNVYYKFLNEETGKELISAKATKCQVGSSFSTDIEETIVDESGKHWIQSSYVGNSIFAAKHKTDAITVNSDETKNNTIVKYKPKLVDAHIQYIDGLGNQIKPEEVKKLQIGSKFSEDVPLKIVDRLGNRWAFNPKSKADVVISEKPDENKIILAYEESKGTVTFKYHDVKGNDIKEFTTQLVQIGNKYVPQYDSIITDNKGCVWEYQERDRESIEVKDDDDENIIVLTYIPLYIDVLVHYVDLWQNEICEPKTYKGQLGSMYKLNLNDDFTNEDGLLYRLKTIAPEEIKIKEIPIGSKKTPNEFTVTFEPINSDVIIKYKDMDGNELRNDEKVHLQVGSKYTPEPAQFIKDKRGNEWELVSAKKDEITVFENPNENVLTYSYDVAKADVILRFINVDGLVICDEQHVPMQVGMEYVPVPEPHLFDKDNKKWKLLDVKPVNLIVGSINNIITVTYQEEKTKVTLKFVDENGNVLKADEKQDAQIGSKYSPKNVNKVIYNAEEIWRLQKAEPYEIVISENSGENVVKLVYSNAKVETEEEEKKEIVNPFANTISAEEKEQMRHSIKDNTFDASKEENLTSNEDTVIFNIDDSKSKTENAGVQEEVDFKDPFLRNLARGMALSNSEKATINQLNNINTQIVEELRKSNEAYMAGTSTFDYSTAEQLIIKEKDMIKANLDKLIAKDKTGARLLKIFEHITASEGDDAIFGRLQQKKAIIITDYFVEKPIDDIDKALYIVEKGKNEEEIKIIERKLSNNFFRNINEAIVLKTSLYYEKIMLENYYKVRTLSADTYFTDASSKGAFDEIVVELVNSTLIRHAMKIFERDIITFDQKNEAEAIINLCDQEVLDKIKAKVNMLDGRLKRNAQAIIKDAGK